MEIISNKEIDNKRFIEFIYTNFKDNTDKVYIDEKITKDSISLKTGELEFKYQFFLTMIGKDMLV